MNPPKVTMRQIAELAGVSVMTVSLALRNHARIRSDTRRRIQAIAERAGYRPHPYVSALMATLKSSRKGEPGPAATLAFIYHFPRATLNSLAFMKTAYEGIRGRARQLGFGVDIFFRDETGADAGHLDRVLKARGIRGVILGPTQGVQTKLDYSLDWSSYALATFGFSVREPDFHRAASFTYHSVRFAYRELWRRGYRRIGLVNTAMMHHRVDGNWRAGHYEAQMEHLGRVIPASVLMSDETAEFLRWLKRFRPDAILCNGSAELGMLERNGYRVPQDIGLATLSPLEPKHSAFFAGVDQRADAIGAAAVDIVAEQLNNNAFGLPLVPKTVMIECTWREGESLRQRKNEEGRMQNGKAKAEG
ncbi:MAG TPA: LacI family DNA-binding transcriptional regulator [Opitutaceae bacterium]|nr:LacI family DNA-binding transcriptional regulator [Opitutaceae bacterium]